jgi:hypothetical protein
MSGTRALELDAALSANEHPIDARETLSLTRPDSHDVDAVEVDLARVEALRTVDLQLLEEAARARAQSQDDDNSAHESSLQSLLATRPRHHARAPFDLAGDKQQTCQRRKSAQLRDSS